MWYLRESLVEEAAHAGRCGQVAQLNEQTQDLSDSNLWLPFQQGVHNLSGAPLRLLLQVGPDVLVGLDQVGDLRMWSTTQ